MAVDTIPTPSHLVGMPEDMGPRELLSRLATAMGGQLADELHELVADPVFQEQVTVAVEALDDLLDAWDETHSQAVVPLKASGSEF